MANKGVTIAISGTYNGRALEKARQDLEKTQIKATAAGDGIASAFVNAGGRIAEAGGEIHNVGYKLEQFGTSCTKYITAPISAAAYACAKAAINIDDSLTGVKKTVDGTEEEYQQLKQAAIEFSKTNAVDASQILDIQALGAQLGYAIDELDDFSQVVSGLDIATDMDAETAATELAQFANITKMAHTDTSNYGSTVVALGNNLATTESKISSMAQRLAASGSQIGMSQADILGLAGALSSLGLEAEGGGSAVSTIMSQIDKDVASATDGVANWAQVAGVSINEMLAHVSAGDDWAKDFAKSQGLTLKGLQSETTGALESLETWADAAQMSATDFAVAWKNDPVQALSALLAGLEDATAEGSNMSLMLDDLGISSIRQTDAMKRMAGNSELVADAVDLANDAWEENTALQKEVDNRNSSMSSRLKILQNKVTAVAESVGTPLVNALLELIDAAEPTLESIAGAAEAFANMDEKTQKTILTVAGVVTAFGPVTTAIGKTTQAAGDFVTGVGKVVQKIGVLIDKDKLAKTATDNVEEATKNAEKALVDMADGADAAKDAIGGVDDASDLAADALDSVDDAADTAADALDAVDDAADIAADGLDAVDDAADIVADGLDAMADGADIASDALDAVDDAADIAKDGLDAMADGADIASDALDTMDDAADIAKDGLDAMADGADIASDALDAVDDAADIAKDGLDAMADGADIASGALDAVDDAADIAKDGLGAMADGADIVTDALDAVDDAADVAADAIDAVDDATDIASEGFEAVSDSTALFGSALDLLPLAAAVAALALVANALQEMKEHEEMVTQATDGLRDATDFMTSSYDDYFASVDAAKTSTDNFTWSVEDFGNHVSNTLEAQRKVREGIENIIESSDDCIEKQAELAGEIQQRWSDIGDQSAKLDYYVGRIEDLAGKANLSKTELAELKVAVERYNEITGDSLEVIDNQTGALNRSKDAILGVADAYKQQAVAQAATELYSEVLEQQMRDEVELEKVQKSITEAQNEYTHALQTYNIPAQIKAQQSVAELSANERELKESIAAADDTMAHYLELMSTAPDTFTNLEDALDSCGVSLEDFGITTEEQMEAASDVISDFEYNFDGTLQSVVDECEKYGIKIPQKLADALEQESGTAKIAANGVGGDTMDGLADGITNNSDKPVSAAEKTANLVTNAMKQTLEIKSPSKVTQEIGKNADEGLANGLKDKQSVVSNAAKTVSSAVKDSVKDLPSSLQNTGKDAGSNLSSGLSSQKSSVQSAGSNLSQSAQTGVSSVKDALLQTGKTAGSNLSSGLSSQKSNVQSAGSTLSQSAQTGVNSVKNALGDTGKTAASNFASGISSVSALSQGQKLATTVNNGISNIKDTMSSTGKKAASNFASGISSVSAYSDAQSLLKTVTNGLNSITATLSNLGKNAAKYFASNLSSVSAYSDGQSLANSAKNGVSSVSAYNTGQNFSYGFVNGMNSVNVYNYGYKLGTTAKQGMNDALGVASPSKEAIKTGKYFGEGAVIGMQSTEGAIADEAKRMGDAMTLTPSAIDELNVNTYDAFTAGREMAESFKQGFESVSVLPSFSLSDYPNYERGEFYGTRYSQQSEPAGRMSVAPSLTLNLTVNANNVEQAKEIGTTLGRSISDEFYLEYARFERQKI